VSARNIAVSPFQVSLIDGGKEKAVNHFIGTEAKTFRPNQGA